MHGKRLPYYFLLFLVLIVIFVLGVQQGQRVERTNKTIAYVLSLTPTQKPVSPTLMKLEGFETYVHKQCAIQFLYPNKIQKDKESTVSAQFKFNNETVLSFNCQTTKPLNVDDKQKVSTASLTFKNQPLKGQQQKFGDIDVYTFQLHHPLTGKTITVAIDKTLYPLFENTLQYK